MGAAMATRLKAQGYDLHVWSRSAASRDAASAQGATLAATPAALAQACDIVISSLFDEAAVRAVYFGADGLLTAGLKHGLLIDTSTLPPGIGAELAAAAHAQGAGFVDAPVLGSVAAARQGQLIALAGGTGRDVEAAKPILSAIARATRVMGPSGAGYAGKLAINLLKATYWATLGDCMALASRFGIESGAILDIVEMGPGASVELALKLPVLRGQKTEPSTGASTKPAPCACAAAKDLRAIVAAGGGPAQVPVAAGALSAVDRAVAGGWAHRDVAAVALFAASQIALNATAEPTAA
jgi:3-hydroxyisobutyrate dehydrogenase